MNAVVTLLDENLSSMVEDLWHFLEHDCGLKGVQVTPIPHFSWQVAEDYDIERLKLAIADCANYYHPFTVTTTGLGVFTGEVPVIYIPVVKNPELIALHERLWYRLMDVRTGTSTHYSPPFWVPHITLAHGDVDHDALVCALSRLAFKNYNWEIKVDNLAFAYQPESESAWTKFRYPFTG